MAIPSSDYLKLKTPRPADIITVEAKAQLVLGYEQSSIELAAVAATELKELCLHAPSSLSDPVMPSMMGTFNAAKDAKAIQIDAKDPGKTIQIGAGLSTKKKVSSSTSSGVTKMLLLGDR
jgi:hypothetical protein